MYKFNNTNEEIVTSEIVIKQLKHLEKYDATVEIKRGEENGKPCYTCTIRSGKTVVKATTPRPEVSAGKACDDFVDKMREDKDRKIDKRICRNRKADERDKSNANS